MSLSLHNWQVSRIETHLPGALVEIWDRLELKLAA